jgi:hypothetical protein
MAGSVYQKIDANNRFSHEIVIGPLASKTATDQSTIRAGEYRKGDHFRATHNILPGQAKVCAHRRDVAGRVIAATRPAFFA